MIQSAKKGLLGILLGDCPNSYHTDVIATNNYTQTHTTHPLQFSYFDLQTGRLLSWEAQWGIKLSVQLFPTHPARWCEIREGD